jgi:hypothetical protein
MTSIVNELSIWTTSNAKTLRDKGVEVIVRIPGPGSNIPWKAGIGLLYGDIIVSYTVWERTIFQTELIVMNSLTEKCVVMDDREPAVAEAIHAELDDVVTRLIDNTFRDMK